MKPHGRGTKDEQTQEGNLQNVLHEIIPLTKKKGQNRALTVGAGKHNGGISLSSCTGIGGLVHIPRFQKEIIINELMRGERSSEPFPVKQKSNKKEKHEKSVIVRRIKSGGTSSTI